MWYNSTVSYSTDKEVIRMGPSDEEIQQSIESAYETIAESNEAVEAVVYEIEHGSDDD